MLAVFLRVRRCGERPVCLVGVSLGARVVFHALGALAVPEDGEEHGVVQDALLLAAPVTSNPARWKRARAAVAGCIVIACVPSFYGTGEGGMWGGVRLGVCVRSPGRGPRLLPDGVPPRPVRRYVADNSALGSL